MKWITGALLSATTLSATMFAGNPAAHAQVPSCVAVVAETESFAVDGKDKDFFTGLAISFILGLTPSTFPFEAIDNLDNTCSRGEFKAGDETFHVYGNQMNSPPRWAVGPDGKRVVYLAIIPPPHVALAWARKRDRGGGLSFKEPALYAFAVTNGDKRDIYGVFAEIPGDAQLLSVFRDALEGRLPAIASFDLATGETNFAR